MKALVTGGAGLIGSHLVDLLLAEGWEVRVLDNLEPQTHLRGAPPWLRPESELIKGDVRDPEALSFALVGVDVVFHLAAYGGYMPEMAKFFDVNSVGTARMLETIRDRRLPVRKVIVASSQAVYAEGAVRCPEHGVVFPGVRPVDQLRTGDFSVRCPGCGALSPSCPTPEQAPIGGDSIYAMTKADQERTVLTWSRQTGIPAVALRFSCTYGPRQSIFNPYTGVIAIFTTRLLAGQQPVIYEDGLQTRDLCFVEDVARANLLAAVSDRADGQAINIGSGVAASIASVADLIGEFLGVEVEPILRGEFRPGEIRALTSDITRARAIGYEPHTDLRAGIAAYLEWILATGEIADRFGGIEAGLREKGIVQMVGSAS
ncbi:MAG TPA: NAD-dependent epimerase/dehydratase family protein [Candidatus Dormibacteraeota bacterium]|nr:NAD-dependent epimerase/dehydratase family protein [Candidatus Dormibacteraeota bacterium]